jgi:hypothetical protein
MSTKIIQDTQIPRLAAPVGVAITSVPIPLKSGYLRITIGSTTSSSGGYIAIGTDPVATQDNYHITSYSVDIIKEQMKRQGIVGVVTGTTTTLLFGENNGNPFVVGEYATVYGAPTAGINTVHNPIIAVGQDYITINYNSSSVTSPNVFGASVAKSVKVSCLTYEPDTFFNIAEVVTLTAE